MVRPPGPRTSGICLFLSFASRFLMTREWKIRAGWSALSPKGNGHTGADSRPQGGAATGMKPQTLVEDCLPAIRLLLAVSLFQRVAIDGTALLEMV
jgi:hypothetical protein